MSTANCSVLLPLCRNTDSTSDGSMSEYSSSDYFDERLRSLWQFLEAEENAGYIQIEDMLWGCAWLHIYLTPSDRCSLATAFNNHATDNRLPEDAFLDLLEEWSKDAYIETMMVRMDMRCTWHDEEDARMTL